MQGRSAARLARRIHCGAVLQNQPKAARAKGFLRESPVKHSTPWLTALRAREKYIADWKQSHPDGVKPPPKTSFSYSDVGTREVADRTPHDSFTSVVLPFKDDPWFLDGYISAFGRLRIGQLFQDLDRLSGIVANKHCAPAQPVIVTASVDRILMLKRLEDLSEHNVVLWGEVTWTGRSSMEITIHAATTDRTEPDLANIVPPTPEQVAKDDVFMVANFTFVARDPETNKAFAINKLVPGTSQEKTNFVRAEKYNHRKKAEASKTSLSLRPPSEQESAIIHDMWLQSRNYIANPESKPDNVVFMDDTKVSSTGVMQPQYRNRHSYQIFGGYLMRQTFELAYTCAAAFAQKPPRFISLDTVVFRAPVPVGSVLYLDAFVTYTEKSTRTITTIDGGSKVCDGTLVQVRVNSTVYTLGHQNPVNTGSFTYSYFVEEQDRVMLPKTYEDMMMYLEGRRRAIEVHQYLEDMGHSALGSE